METCTDHIDQITRIVPDQNTIILQTRVTFESAYQAYRARPEHYEAPCVISCKTWIHVYDRTAETCTVQIIQMLQMSSLEKLVQMMQIRENDLSGPYNRDVVPVWNLAW